LLRQVFPSRFVHGRFTEFVAISLLRLSGRTMAAAGLVQWAMAATDLLHRSPRPADRLLRATGSNPGHATSDTDIRFKFAI
jgi:hypothetical protein